MRSARSRRGLSIRQCSAKMLRAPPEISLPIVTPPWPSFIVQLRTMTFSIGVLHAAAVVVAARLDRDAVVAGVERAALDQHVAARLGIAAVVVRPVAADRDVAHRDVLAQHRMDLPHRRVDDRHALDEHVAAAIRLDEVRPQLVPRRRTRVLCTGTPRSPMSSSRSRAGACFDRAAGPSPRQFHHASALAWPSSVPVPVIAMFSASNA